MVKPRTDENGSGFTEEREQQRFMKLGKIKTYVKEHGIRSSVVLTMDRLLHRHLSEISYDKWLQRNRPSSRDYDRMEKSSRVDGPVFSVIASMDEEDRLAFMQSLEMQVYRKFQGRKNNPPTEYTLVVGGPATLRPDLLWQCARLLDQDKEQAADLIYFDSDLIGEDGCKVNPSFRPEYDPDLLNEVNYMGSVVLVRSELFQYHDLPSGRGDSFHTFLKKICRSEESAQTHTRAPLVCHIPQVLYHELVRENEEEMGPEGRRGFHPAVAQTSAHRNNNADREANVYKSIDPAGEIHVNKYSDPATQPLVSVLIPNKDHREDLERCITSLLEGNTWKNLEILIIENNSSMDETFACYKEIQAKDERVRVVTWEGPFNYSAINNYGFQYARGEYILLLNNDTKILEEDSIAEMVTQASRPEVGAVGALLLYPEGTVQHGGIILGHGGIASHAWEGENPLNINGQFQEMVFSHLHNVSAVTGACMMLKHSDYEAAGGLDESLEVTFNDVDLCLKLRDKGLRVLMCPMAQLIHYESASRGSEDSPQKVKRFHKEISIFVHRWEKELEKGDPFYNPNLTLIGKTWTCKDDLRESARPYLKYLHMEVEEE